VLPAIQFFSIHIFNGITGTTIMKKTLVVDNDRIVLRFMKKDNPIDPDIYDLFIGSRLYYDYAEKEMDPKQTD